MSTVCYCGQPTCPVTGAANPGACIDAAQAENTALRAEAKERQRVLEQAIEERMSALSERNWANERHEEVVAENAVLKARVAELEALHESLGASLRKVGQDGLASVVDLTRERDEWKAKATEAAAQAERLREALLSLRRGLDDAGVLDSYTQGDTTARDEFDAALSEPIAPWLAERDRELATRVATDVVYALHRRNHGLGDLNLDAIVDAALKEKP